MRVRFFLLLGVGILLWAISAQAGGLDTNAKAIDMQVPHTHKYAPGFSLDMLDGTKRALADYRGKVVLINFWATWCVPCRHEMPQIERLWNRYRDDGLVVLGVNVDRGNLDGVREFMRQSNLTFPCLLDPAGAVRNTYEISALPTSYLIGSDGKIIGRIIGQRDWFGDAAIQLIEFLLKKGEYP